MHANYRIKTAIREICKEFHAPHDFFANLAYHMYAAAIEKSRYARKLSHKNSDTKICKEFHAPNDFFTNPAYHKYAAAIGKSRYARKLSHKNGDTGNLQRICGFFTTAKTTTI